MKNLPLLIGTLVITVVLVVALSLFFSNSNQTQSKPVDPTLLINKTQDVKGPENAKVTVVEFGDFQCPACGATEPLVRQVLQKYPNQVRFVFRNFPLTEIHQNAQQAALTAQAAGAMGKFWEMHDYLYDHQDEWAELSGDAVKAKFTEYLTKLQIDKTEFGKRIDSQAVHDQVTEDIADGTKAGVDATPTFYVNGQKTAAPQLLATVESLLASK